MGMTDPIADLLSRIRNAQSAKHDIVSVPASNIKKAILGILKHEGFEAQRARHKTFRSCTARQRDHPD